jgi:lipopolysaccharide transport system permease protein
MEKREEKEKKINLIMPDNNRWTTIISAKHKGIRLNLKEIYRYKDLILLLTRRDIVAMYKQTILGPVWFVLQPLLTTITFTLIFGKIAKLSTDNTPPILFYLSGVIVWNYFSETLIKTSNTFIANANLFGKVYFPRLVVPLSISLSNLLTFFVQFVFFLIIYLYYLYQGKVSPGYSIIYVPVLLIIMSALGLGMGVIISALTTKYRDMRFLITFGVQLFMFLSPVVYPLSSMSHQAQKLMLLNPMAPVLEFFKCAFLQTPAPPLYSLVYSLFFSILTLLSGIIIFNKVEKNFMDTV